METQGETRKCAGTCDVCQSASKRLMEFVAFDAGQDELGVAVCLSCLRRAVETLEPGV